MKTKILCAASLLALSFSVTAYADDPRITGTTNVDTNAVIKSRTAGDITADHTNGAEFKQGMTDIKDGTVSTVKGIGSTAKSAYEDIKAEFIDEKNEMTTPVIISSRMTASGMIGKSVVNTKEESVATVKDIILDENGNAKIIVISDGGVLGFDKKLAAFDYNSVITQNADGDVIMPLSEATIKKVSEFSYSPKDKSDKVVVMPAGGYSADKLLKSKLMDANGKKVGSVDNISFRNGGLTNLIVSYDQTMGMGGKKAAFAFHDLTLVNAKDGTADFKMNSKQSAKFEQFKNSQAN